ncbi:hypothetical protein WJX82_009350 [Trebouxia sp. C0006]
MLSHTAASRGCCQPGSCHRSSKYGDDLTFTEASVECIPGPNTAATEKLAVLLHESLRPHLTSFTGVEVNFSESTAALVNVSTDADVTFWASRLESVNAWNLSSIDNDARPDAGQVADAFHTQDGGAIYLFGGQNMDILGGTFSNNSAFASGGAINSWQLSNSTFHSNQAQVGGAVYGARYSRFNATASTRFTNNTATLNGGAFYCDNCDWLAVGQGAVVQGNSAGVGGGGLYCDQCSGFQLNGAHLLSNKATNGSGGGVYLAANGATLSNITHTEFNSNTAGADEGGLNVTGGATVLTGNIFIGNSAAGLGGAVAYTKQCFFAGDEEYALSWAYFYPGIAHLTGSCSSFISLQDSFQDNYAVNGGDYISNGTALPLKTVAILDQGNTQVIRGQIRVSIAVVNISSLQPADADLVPYFEGQADGLTNASGIASFDGLILRAAPGKYKLLLSLPDYPQVPNATVTVRVPRCGIGSVQQDPTLCLYCAAPLYSFSPDNSSCDSPCPTNANCTGGAHMTPLPGY